MRRVITVTAMVVAAAAIGACGSTTTTSTSPTTASGYGKGNPTTTVSGGGPTTVAAGRADVKLADSSLGRIVVDADGSTLYAFKPDTSTTSACNDACAATWPPATTASKPRGDGLGQQYLGTITRADGTEQITYYGHPLYTYGGDTRPGDTAGQGIGGTWHVVNATGSPVMQAPTSSPTTARSGY